MAFRHRRRRLWLWDGGASDLFDGVSVLLLETATDKLLLEGGTDAILLEGSVS